ncbi:MAG TPA: c-type cytochrome domain-containing protein [Chitinophagaceae bacterium]|nr:c-type cytochrome domain-containing protein [Chitinophagaceae bacterium]
MKKWLATLGIIALLGSLNACKHEVTQPGTGGGGNGGGGGTDTTPQVTCSPDTVYFQQAILPILVSNCAVPGCHDATSHQEGYVFTNYQNVMKVVKPGRPRDSELYEVITENDPDDRMPRPPRAPLTSQQIALIEKWIRQGAKDNSCTSGCDTSNVRFATTIQPILQTYCMGCHSGTNASGGISFSTYAGVKTQIDNGKLWAAINHTGPRPMPLGGNKLSDCNIDKFGIWIRNGAPNN